MTNKIATQDQPLDWQKEFKIDSVTGQVFGSRHGLARLCGVSQPAMSKLVNRIGDNQNTPKELEMFAGQSFRGDNQLPDLLMAAVIKYYAFKGVETAQQTLSAFLAIGLRSYGQQKLDWKPAPAPSLPAQPTEQLGTKSTLEALAVATQAMRESGVPSAIAHQWQLEQIGKVIPGLQAGLKAAGAMVSAAKPMNPLPVNRTELGRRLGQYLRLEVAPSAIKVNEALEKIGLQERDPVSRKWRLTEDGKDFGEPQITVINGSPRQHIRWDADVIEKLATEFTIPTLN